MVHFSKEKKRVGYLVSFIFLVGLKKPGVFLVRSNYMNPEDYYGRLIDFLS